MNNILKGLIKYGSSLIAAFIAVNALSYFYYNQPQAGSNYLGFTSVKHKANKACFNGTEGYGITKVDANGFNNVGDVSPDDAKIVCIGSSQTIAVGVDTEKNYVSVLNTLSASNRAYNLGVSGQFLYASMSRIPKIIQNFHNVKVIVIETPVFPTIGQLQKIEKDLLLDTVDVNDVDGIYRNPVKSFLRTLPYDRLLHSKLGGVLVREGEKNVKSSNVFDDIKYKELVNSCFSTLVAKTKGVELILLYLSLPVFAKNGDYLLEGTSLALQQKEIIKNACEANGVVFIETGSYFIENFNRTKQPANGFLNSRIATGHINAHGYKIIAKILNEKIKKLLEKEVVK